MEGLRRGVSSGLFARRTLTPEPRPFSGRIALQQRVLPAYRAPFFEALSDACDGGLSLFAGQPLDLEQIAVSESLENAEFYLTRNLHFRHPGSPLYLCWQQGILTWLESRRPDTLIVEANPRYASTRLAIDWMKRRGKPVLGWGLGAPPAHGLFGAVRQWRRRGFLDRLDAIIAYSQRGAEEYCDAGFPEERIFVAKNAVAPAPKSPAPARPALLEGRPKALFVGRLQARKRIDLLLHACAQLPEPMQPSLWVVGDGPARGDFQMLANEIYPRAEFLGSRYGEALEGFFTAADIFILPGTGGLAVQQAMSFGLPVIVAQGDGTQDDLVRAGNGWRIPAGDQKALTAAMLAAFSDTPRLRQMGLESYRIVSQEVNIEQMVTVFLQALHSVSAL